MKAVLEYGKSKLTFIILILKEYKTIFDRDSKAREIFPESLFFVAPQKNTM